MYLSSSDLEMADDGSNTGQTTGLRFSSIDIPQGAVISASYIQFQVDEVSTGASSLMIRGEDTNDAAAFTTARFNVSSRNGTAAFALWEPDVWTTKGAAGLAQRTSDLTGIVQEIVNRGDWAALNDLAFIITGSGVRTAEAFEGSAAGAPLLHVEYMLPDNGNAAPVLDLDFNDSTVAGTGYATTFVENGAPVAVADVDTVITDTDDTDMERATLTLTNARAGDELTVNQIGLPPGITVNAASTATQVILSGTAPLADYQSALQQVLFHNPGATPDPVDRLINVVMNDGSGNSNTAVATVAIDLLPAAVDDSAAGLVNTTTVTGNVLANDDQGNAPATLFAYDAIGVSGGTVVSNGNGTFTYTPVTNFTGTDAFTYTIQDTNGDQSSATVTVNVTAGGNSGPPTVVGIHTMWSHNVPDPSGIAYDPASNRLLISDSEVDELSIFNGEDLFAFNLSPAGLDAAPDETFDLPFTPEATGLAIDGNLNRMYITDDDESAIFVVDPSDPTALLWSFDVSGLGSDDTEDVAVDPVTGNIFIINGISRTIQEVALDHASQSRTLVDTLSLSDPEIADPEAIAYDPTHDVFLVGGGFSPNIWIVDRNGDTQLKVDLLKDFRNDHVPGGSGTTRTNVKDIALAPASDGSGETHIYVADFGNSHVLDGRLIEIDPGSIFEDVLIAAFQLEDTPFV